MHVLKTFKFQRNENMGSLIGLSTVEVFFVPSGNYKVALRQLKLPPHRRRIKTEEKAKVIAAAWGTELIQSLPR